MHEWNRRHPELPMKRATPETYFTYVVGRRQVQAILRDATAHWELVNLGSPEVADRMRQTSALLPAAETLHRISTLVRREDDPWLDFADAWRELSVFTSLLRALVLVGLDALCSLLIENLPSKVCHSDPARTLNDEGSQLRYQEARAISMTHPARSVEPMCRIPRCSYLFRTSDSTDRGMPERIRRP